MLDTKVIPEMEALKFLSIFCCICSSVYASTGVFFTEIELSNSDKMKEGFTSSVPIDKSFHLCSLQDTCNYVIRDTVTDEYQMFANESVLPADKALMQIWKKEKG